MSCKGAFAGATLPAPGGVNAVFVAGLATQTIYVAGIQPCGGDNVISIISGSNGTMTDGAGVVRLTF